MSLPETVRVKLSSETAEYISMTPVVVRDMPVRELMEMMLGVTGKDLARMHELLLRGNLVSGASRLRWQGFAADRDSIRAHLQTFPDPDPTRPFAAGSCVRAVLKGASCRIDIPREVGAETRLFHRKSFWDLLMEFASEAHPRYLEYSYKQRADSYLADVSPPAARIFRENARRVRYTVLERQIRAASPEEIEFFVARP